jgi:hypothetical protein
VDCGRTAQAALQIARAGAEQFVHWLSETFGARAVHESVPAAVRGAKGNQEWMVHFRLEPST